MRSPAFQVGDGEVSGGVAPQILHRQLEEALVVVAQAQKRNKVSS